MDLASLPSAVVHDAIFTHRSRLGRSHRIDIVRRVLDAVVTKRGVAQFMAYEECLVEY